MQRSSLDDQMDNALGSILAQGWDDNPADPEPMPEPAATPPDYPPLPVRTDEPAPPAAGHEAPDRMHLNIGLLTDLAAGRKGAAEAAEAAGVTPDDLQAALATALRGVDPKEISKALGLQAAEQQLKSGALYGAVLFDLVKDMQEGRLKPDTKIELAKLLAKVGRIEPKDEKGAGAGSGFVLNINLGTNSPAPVTIEPVNSLEL